MTWEIINGDCLDVMKTFPDNHFSAIVTDPPYGLSFMNKGWDHAVPGAEYWRECLRITKPGGYLLSLGGSRTFHRLTCSAEDAGWEIRDCVMWIYGSGFPKSHNHFGIEGYGTALKPAYEPIIMAMKPLDGTFKQNAEEWGQAGINVDGCRIPSNDVSGWAISGSKESENTSMSGKNYARDPKPDNPKGRWPANVIFDEEAAAILNEQSGITTSSGGAGKKTGGHGLGDSGGASRFFYCAKASSRERNEGLEGLPEKAGDRWPQSLDGNDKRYAAPKKNNHPTVKPLKLMEYLIKLVMPPSNGLLLDPFAGSGSTILAATRLGFDAIGIEKQPEYCEIARERIKSDTETFKNEDLQMKFENMG